MTAQHRNGYPVDMTTRARQMRVGGETLTIPAAKVPRLEAIEAREYASEQERDAAVKAAAEYLADVPDELAPVVAEIRTGADALAAAREVVRLADERGQAVLRAVTTNGRRLNATRLKHNQAVAAARAVATLAVEDGVSEAAVARALGIDRLTLRRWLGKQDRK